MTDFGPQLRTLGLDFEERARVDRALGILVEPLGACGPAMEIFPAPRVDRIIMGLIGGRKQKGPFEVCLFMALPQAL